MNSMLTTNPSSPANLAGTEYSVTASTPNCWAIIKLSMFSAIDVKIESTKKREPMETRSKEYARENSVNFGFSSRCFEKKQKAEQSIMAIGGNAYARTTIQPAIFSQIANKQSTTESKAAMICHTLVSNVFWQASITR